MCPQDDGVISGGQRDLERIELPAGIIVAPAIAIAGESRQRVAGAVSIARSIQLEDRFAEFIVLVVLVESEPVSKTDRGGGGCIESEPARPAARW